MAWTVPYGLDEQLVLQYHKLLRISDAAVDTLLAYQDPDLWKRRYLTCLERSTDKKVSCLTAKVVEMA